MPAEPSNRGLSGAVHRTAGRAAAIKAQAEALRQRKLESGLIELGASNAAREAAERAKAADLEAAQEMSNLAPATPPTKQHRLWALPHFRALLLGTVDESSVLLMLPKTTSGPKRVLPPPPPP